ncbi:MAG: pyruvate ferredoxin oxidoreductase [Deltaproteobacteria bacterium]|nr:MAG: pyruvate ferredoxin oxidoreductase [Deltaproteobacteria bacterium]
MSQRMGIEVSIAAAEAAALANVDVVAAYPITPQTHIVEHLAELVADGSLNAEYIAVESEHSAISACLGASAAGGRTFTASASQGLALMHEILFAASSMRMPIIMAVANRAISAPINIWADHSDIMPQRDTGWGQVFAQNGQEVFDLILQAFKVAEDHRVQLPIMVNMDGFILSHMIEAIEMLDTNEVKSFLPEMNPLRMLDPELPRSIGAFGAQNVYTEVKMAQDMALDQSALVWEDVWNEFSEKFGRRYKSLDTCQTEDADTIFITMGSLSETARSAIIEMRETEEKVGFINLRLWRPFPGKILKKAIGNAKKVIVIDRMLSPGSQGGPLGLELRATYCNEIKHPKIWNFIVGLGGRLISRQTLKKIHEDVRGNKHLPEKYYLYDARVK